MSNPALDLYNSIDSYKDLEALIDDAESESLFLECKSPINAPRLNEGVRVHLAKAVSGFSNTAGGIVIWGAATTRHAHSGLDIISDIEPIGNCKKFAQTIGSRISSLTTPPCLGFQVKTIKKTPSDGRGVVIAYVPQTSGDPLRTTTDSRFCFRDSDGFINAPYEVIKRLFSATQSPDIRAIISHESIEQDNNDIWRIPITVRNLSSAIGEHVEITICVENPENCDQIKGRTFIDVSHVNPGKKLFNASLQAAVLHKGLSIVAGEMRIKMKGGAHPKRRLDLTICVYANKMRATEEVYKLDLAKSKVAVKLIKSDFVY